MLTFDIALHDLLFDASSCFAGVFNFAGVSNFTKRPIEQELTPFLTSLLLLGDLAILRHFKQTQLNFLPVSQMIGLLMLRRSPYYSDYRHHCQKSLSSFFSYLNGNNQFAPLFQAASYFSFLSWLPVRKFNLAFNQNLSVQPPKKEEIQKAKQWMDAFQKQLLPQLPEGSKSNLFMPLLPKECTEICGQRIAAHYIVKDTACFIDFNSDPASQIYRALSVILLQESYQSLCRILPKKINRFLIFQPDSAQIITIHTDLLPSKSIQNAIRRIQKNSRLFY